VPDTHRSSHGRVLVAGVALAITGLAAWPAGYVSPQITKREGMASAAQAPVVARALPGVPAPPQTIAELRGTLTAAVGRFEAHDAAGVLAHVSERYRTSPMTKPLLRDQLAALFGLYDAVRARVDLDDVRMVGDQAWFWSTGEVTGRLALVGQWMPVLAWERELEVARREDGRWRLYGYQQ
jgi:hypothetical protein